MVELEKIGFIGYDKDKFNRNEIAELKMMNVLRWSIMHKFTNAGIIAEIIGAPQNETGKFSMSGVHNFIQKMIRKDLLKGVIMPQTYHRRVYIATQKGLDHAQMLYQDVDLTFHNTDISKINGNKVNHDLLAQRAALSIVQNSNEKISYMSEKEFARSNDEWNFEAEEKRNAILRAEKESKGSSGFAPPFVSFTRRPDFVIERGGKTVAYEIEVSVKSKSLYNNIVKNYAEGIRQGRIDKVVYFCAHKQIYNTLKDKVAEHGKIKHRGKIFMNKDKFFEHDYSSRFEIVISKKLLISLMGNSVAARFN